MFWYGQHRTPRTSKGVSGRGKKKIKQLVRSFGTERHLSCLIRILFVYFSQIIITDDQTRNKQLYVEYRRFDKFSTNYIHK